MSDSKQGLSEQDALSINTIRCLAADMVQAANSGHPGMPMGMAPIAHVLWRKFLRSSPSNPKWYNRDRFVLSNGHGCALLYIMLHLTGNEVTLDDLKGFRKLGSRTPGHPENLDTPGVEVTTGPLGQGIANAVGLAMAESYMATNFNKPGFELFNNHTFVFLGDGCLQEGISHEACSLAGHLGLGNLIVMYDDNHITIDGDTGLSFSEDIPKRFESYGWHTQVVGDGETNLDNIEKAISNAIAVKDKPSIICIRTIIGFGSSKQGTEHVHGAPLGDDEIVKVKTKFGFDPSKKFYVPDAVVEEYGQVKARGAAAESDWNALFESYKAKYPAEAAELVRRFNREPPKDWEKALPAWKPSDKADATRNTSNVVLNAMANAFPELVGGSADLTGSNKTALKGAKDFEKNNHGGRYLRFGVREHAMVAIANGFYVYGCFIPFTATFLNFIEYCFPAVRLAALSHIQQILIMTHDSIGLGEDGPTHQPVEAVNLVRATPNTLLLRPADGNEVAGSYLAALKFVSGPSVICASRHNLPNLPNTSAENVLKGAYVIVDPDEGKTKPDLILVGTGSETHLCVAAASKIGSKVRVVSMPSWELFDAQSVEYRRSVFIPGVPVVSVEAAALQGWQKYAHAHIGMTTFGKSGSVEDVFEYFGFTADKIAETVKQRIDTLKKQCEELGLPFAASPLPTHFHVKY